MSDFSQNNMSHSHNVVIANTLSAMELLLKQNGQCFQEQDSKSVQKKGYRATLDGLTLTAYTLTPDKNQKNSYWEIYQGNSPCFATRVQTTHAVIKGLSQGPWYKQLHQLFEETSDFHSIAAEEPSPEEYGYVAQLVKKAVLENLAKKLCETAQCILQHGIHFASEKQRSKKQDTLTCRAYEKEDLELSRTRRERRRPNSVSEHLELTICYEDQLRLRAEAAHTYFPKKPNRQENPRINWEITLFDQDPGWTIALQQAYENCYPKK